MKKRRWWGLVGCGVAVGLVVAGLVLVWPDGDSPRESGPIASTSVSVPADDIEDPDVRAAEQVDPDGAGRTVVAATSDRLPNDRLPPAEVLDVRWIRDAGGTPVERWRLVRFEAEPDRPARVIDHLNRDVTGWLISRQEVMRADSVVVVVPPAGRASEIALLLEQAGYAFGPVRDQDAAIDVRLPDGSLDAVPEAMADLSVLLPGVDIEPNWIYFPSRVIPSDYDASSAWGLEFVEAPAAWTIGTGGAEVVVAVIDSGLDYDHPDLAANIWTHPGETADNGIDDDGNGFIDDVSGWDFVDDEADASDEAGHGTHVAGILGAVGNNALGVVGVNWQVRIIPLRVGDGVFDNAATLNALRYVNNLREAGIPIVAVNASYGGSSFSSAFLEELLVARDREILFVAAAGNDAANNDTSPFYPSGYAAENVIAVASLNQGGRLSDFSSFGATSVDIAAPGTGIRSTFPGETYGYSDGTSMAAPHVTGAAALAASIDPGLSAASLRDRILQSALTAPELAGRVATGGSLNLRRVVAPGLLAPKVAIVAPAADLIALENAGQAIGLVAALVPEDGVTPAATFSWETVEGPAAAQFSAPTAAATSASFPANGIYRLRVRTVAGALTGAAEITVVVGTAAPPESGLVAWWGFEETTGPALDSSGHSRSGTVNGARRNRGVIGGGMRFDGVSSNISFSAPATSQLSVLAWAQADSGGSSIFPRVVHMQEGLLFLGLDPFGDDGNGNNLKFTLDDGVEDRVWHTPSYTIETGEMRHLAVTFDAAVADSTPLLYIDGRNYVVGVQDGAARPPDVAAGAGFIGDRGDGARAWDGLLDEIRIYNRELSAAEVAVVAREPVVHAVRASTLLALSPKAPLAVELSLLRAPLFDETFGVASTVWSSPDPEVTVSPLGPGSVRVSATGAGEYAVRMDLTTDNGTHVVRTFTVILNDATVTAEGYYTGTTSDGSTFVLHVDGAGAATFVGGGRAARLARRFPVSDFGTFEVSNPGQALSGFVDATGRVRGHLGNVTFSGSRVPDLPGDANEDWEGFYSGGVLRSEYRSNAMIAGTRLALVIEEDGLAVAGEGALTSGGTFAFDSSIGAVSGSVGSDRITGTVALDSGGMQSFVLLREGGEANRRLANLSVRAPAGHGEETMIVGFVLEGEDTLPVMLRGVGPGLEVFNVSNVLATPLLSLFQSSTVLAENVGWDSGEPSISEEIAANAERIGAFALTAGGADSALFVDLPGGAFTAHVRGADGGSGTALAEIYDARATDRDARLVNLSARGPVGVDQNIPIAGFVVGGDAPAFVLVRAIGPGLTAFGLDGVLSKPVITVYSGQELFASAAVWAVGEKADHLADVMAQVGAFPLDPELEDAAMLLYLPPGPYTAHVRGDEDATGVALLEVYFVAEP